MDVNPETGEIVIEENLNFVVNSLLKSIDKQSNGIDTLKLLKYCVCFGANCIRTDFLLPLFNNDATVLQNAVDTLVRFKLLTVLEPYDFFKYTGVCYTVHAKYIKEIISQIKQKSTKEFEMVVEDLIQMIQIPDLLYQEIDVPIITMIWNNLLKFDELIDKYALTTVDCLNRNFVWYCAFFKKMEIKILFERVMDKYCNDGEKHIGLNVNCISKLTNYSNLPFPKTHNIKNHWYQLPLYLIPLHMEIAEVNIPLATSLIRYGADIDLMDSNQNTALFHAIKTNNIEVIKFLVDCGANVNHTNNRGDSPLLFAAILGYIDVVKYLLDHGADYHHQNNMGLPVLHVATRYNKYEVVKFLLSTKKLNVNGLAKNKIPAIFYAVDCDMLKIFIDNGANLNIKTGNGRPLIYEHLIYEDRFKLLVENGCNINVKIPEGSTPFIYALKKCNDDILQLCCDYKVDQTIPDNKGNYPIHYARSYTIEYIKVDEKSVKFVNNLGETSFFRILQKTYLYDQQKAYEIAEKFLAAGADINHKDNSGNTILHHMTARNNPEEVKFLLDHKADTNITNNEGKLPAFICFYNATMLKLILDAGFDVNTKNVNGYTLLHFAARGNYSNIVRMLIEYGANIDEKTPDGKNAFILALEQCAFDAISIFVSKGELEKYKIETDPYENMSVVEDFGEEYDWIPISITKKRKLSPLLKSILNEKYDEFKVLIENNVNQNICDANGDTPLHLAKPQFFSLLTLNSENVDITNNMGETPLFKALIQDKPYFEIADKLLAAGANINHIDKNGFTLLHRAIYHKNFKLVKYLKKNKANLQLNSKHGVPPLFSIISQDSEDSELNRPIFNIMDYLLDKGVDINAQNKHGETLLHYVVRRDYKTMAKYLISHGANIEIVDKNGNNVLYLSLKCRSYDVAELLIENGAVSIFMDIFAKNV